MEMDIDGVSKPKDEKDCEEEKEMGKPIVAILVGAPASGKSTFCENVMRASSRPWVRICQDTINNGKSGTKPQCLKSAVASLKDRKSVFIDRCNLEKEQRADFVKLGGPEVEVHAVVLDLPAKLCISRIAKRTGHEGNLQGGKAAQVVNRMLQKKELPKLNEGFSRITFCRNETDVEAAVKAYTAVGLFDTLPHGCFGEKDPNAKTQLGIMKFLKRPHETDTKDSVASQLIENSLCGKTQETVSSSSGTASQKIKVSEDPVPGSVGQDDSDVPTLAFPSISTADFQFNLEKASDIIVEKVEEFMDKLGKARLVLVDLTERSKILSLVKAKAAEKNIDTKRFFTFVGDICELYTKGGLRCNAIANAANWRLKPGGGGVNAAIFNAGGPALEAATMDRAKSLLPGNALVVPLPSTSPLYSKEGVTHVIHVLGPNMNPNRPNCLDNDYIKGCKVLRDAYSSLFKGFLSIANTQVKLPSSSESILSGPSKLESEISGAKKNSWAPHLQSLYNIAMRPEKYNNQVLEASDDVVVLNDMYPKAKRHLLVLARIEGLDALADVRKEHYHLLKTMHEVGLRWADKFIDEDASLIFRLGYHSVPSMRQLHLHVISQDFDSQCLKHKKHWNSFTTAFFRDSVDVLEEVNNHGKATIRDENRLMMMELRCHRCRSAHPNIPRLKSHISNCKAPFPADLQKKGCLVPAQTNSGSDP